MSSNDKTVTFPAYTMPGRGEPPVAGGGAENPARVQTSGRRRQHRDIGSPVCHQCTAGRRSRDRARTVTAWAVAVLFVEIPVILLTAAVLAIGGVL